MMSFYFTVGVILHQERVWGLVLFLYIRWDCHMVHTLVHTKRALDIGKQQKWL